MRHTKIYAGSASPEFAKLIVEHIGISVGQSSVTKFANKETSVVVGESVRGEDVYIVQTGCGNVNDAIMELVIMVSACKMASAKRVTAVIPYMPYSKQCKKKKRNSIVTRLVANMLQVAGVDHIMTMDLHASQTSGFFNVPVDNLVAEPTIAEYIRSNIHDYKNGVVVAKNAGGTKRVTAMADKLDVDFALVQCTNETRKTANESKVYTVVGEVQGKVAFVLDDHIDSPKEFIAAANTLIERGALRVYIIATHGIFSGDSLRKLHEAESVYEIIVTNTLPAPSNFSTPKLKIMDVSDTFAEAIRRTHNGESISYLFYHTPEELYQ